MPLLLKYGSGRVENAASIARSWKLLLSVAGWYALALAACAGCAAPNLYTTPRAAPVDKFTGVVAPQLVRRPELREQGNMLLLAARLGLAPRFDAGVRTNLAAVAADIKWNAIRTQHFDLALDGGVELLPETLYVDLPVLLGINLSEAVSLLPTTGITLGEGTQPSMDSKQTYYDGIRDRPRAGRLFVRAGLGAQFRITPRFAVEPEFTYVGPVRVNNGTSEYFAAGVGFCFGPLAY
jgi:hypothetical protein